MKKLLWLLGTDQHKTPIQKKTERRILINWSAHIHLLVECLLASAIWWLSWTRFQVVAISSRCVAWMWVCSHDVNYNFIVYSTLYHLFLRKYPLLSLFLSFILHFPILFSMFFFSLLSSTFFFVEHVADITCSLLLDLCHVWYYWKP